MMRSASRPYRQCLCVSKCAVKQDFDCAARHSYADDTNLVFRPYRQCLCVRKKQ